MLQHAITACTLLRFDHMGPESSPRVREKSLRYQYSMNSNSSVMVKARKQPKLLNREEAPNPDSTSSGLLELLQVTIAPYNRYEPVTSHFCAFSVNWVLHSPNPPPKPRPILTTRPLPQKISSRRVVIKIIIPVPAVALNQFRRAASNRAADMCVSPIDRGSVLYFGASAQIGGRRQYRNLPSP